MEEHCRDEHHGIFCASLEDGDSDLAQVGTHADSLIAEAVVKGIKNFDLQTAFDAVLKDATVPPADDWTIS